MDQSTVDVSSFMLPVPYITNQCTDVNCREQLMSQARVFHAPDLSWGERFSTSCNLSWSLASSAAAESG